MELINATRMEAAYTLGMEPSGREHLVVVVKGTFAMPGRDGETARPAETQIPLLMADTFEGEPGLSAPRQEMDFALRKPACDVLVNGAAHAPPDRQATRVTVGIRLGSWQKSFDVVGDRVWLQQAGAVGISEPLPFSTMPVTYGRAFGGVDDLDPDPSRHAAYPANPVGRGWHRLASRALIDGAPLPNTEARDDPVTAPWNDHRPMSLGPVGRNFQPRLAHAGTYDDAWMADVLPFLPADFDDRYYQAAPPDQQVPRLEGGEEVILVGLTPNGRCRFTLPPLGLGATIIPRRGAWVERPFTADTIVFEPDAGRFAVTWRLQHALRRDVFEVGQVIVGDPGRAWMRARRLGKVYFPSLGHLVRTRRRGEALDEPDER